jgi:hypothetical protein
MIVDETYRAAEILNSDMEKIQERGVDLALRGHNILLTGFPGTRKSFTFIEMGTTFSHQECNSLKMAFFKTTILSL